MKRYILLALAILFLAVYLFPLYWMYLTAFKPSTETFVYPPTFWPGDPQFNFADVFVSKKMSSYLWNSLVIAIGTTAIAAFFGTGCAYALARVRNIGMDIVLFLILMMQVLPSSLMATPIFVLFNQIGLIATPRLAVVLAQAAKVLPLFIVLTRTSFMQIPKELEEAARVDGATRFGAFLRIAVPLARNGILVTSVLIFLQSFGEYVYSRSMISEESLQTATVGLMNFMGPNTTDWNGIMTYSVIYVTPILLVFVLLQRKIVSGLTAGALK